MNILVTGASGFVGRALCAHLGTSHTVFGTTRHEGASLPQGVRTIVWNADPGQPPDLPAVDLVVHLAARVHVMRDTVADPLAQFRLINVRATRRLALWAAGRGVRRFVYMSSVKVNGESTRAGAAFRAGDDPAPADAYAVSKWEAEQALRQVARDTGMEVVVVRTPLVYGPGVGGNMAAMVRWLRSGMPLPLGAIDNRRSLIALDSLVAFTALCADPEKSPRAAGETFLIADSEVVSTPELIRRVAAAYKLKARLMPVPPGCIRWAALLAGKSEWADRLLGSLVVDDSKARSMLGWRPVVAMDDQLLKMARHDAARN